MTKVSISSSITFLIFSILTISNSSCKGDDELDRQQFLGTYSVIENCPSSGVDNYDITITSSSTTNAGVIISNFYGTNLTINASVVGSSLTIPQQTVTYQGVAVNLNGSGTINGLTLTLAYTITIGSSGESCSMTCTKR